MTIIVYTESGEAIKKYRDIVKFWIDEKNNVWVVDDVDNEFTIVGGIVIIENKK